MKTETDLKTVFVLRYYEEKQDKTDNSHQRYFHLSTWWEFVSHATY